MSPVEPPGAGAADIVRQAARDGEIDRYLAALMAPPAIREDLLALAAFAAVIGHIPDAVHEPMMGEMRLQWWRDALQCGARGEASGNPVADAVTAARARRGLAPEMLDNVIDAVSEAVSAETPTETGWDGAHAIARFEGQVFAMTAHIHAGGQVTGCESLFERAGLAYGFARALCRLPFAITSGWPPLPLGLTAGEPDHAGLAVDVVEVRRLHAMVRDTLGEVRRHLYAAPPAAIAALTPLVMVEPYLSAQSQSLETLLVSPVEVLPLKRMWRIWRAHRRHRL